MWFMQYQADAFKLLPERRLSVSQGYPLPSWLQGLNYCRIRIIIACRKQHLPAKSRVRTAFHALAPGFTTKCRGTSAACTATRATGTASTTMSTMSIARTASTNTSSRHRARPLNGTIEIHAYPVTCLSRILVCQCEYKRCHIPDGGASASRSNAGATLRLTEIHHVQGQWEIRVIRWRITTQQIGHLPASRQIKSLSRSLLWQLLPATHLHRWRLATLHALGHRWCCMGAHNSHVVDEARA